MTAVQPQHLLHRGVVEAAAFHFNTRLLTATEARRRILALWTPGAIVYRLPDGHLLLRLSASRRVCCEDAPGLPLVRADGLLLGAPLTPDERRKLDAPPGAAVLMAGGSTLVYDLARANTEDPADWLDVSDWTGLRGTSLGAPPAKPRVVGEPATFDARAQMPDVPPEAPERVFVLEALRRAARGERVSDEAPGNAGGLAGGIGGRVGGWLQHRLLSQ